MVPTDSGEIEDKYWYRNLEIRSLEFDLMTTHHTVNIRLPDLDTQRTVTPKKTNTINLP